MPGRIEPPAGAVNRYKYGFNGKENDNEVVGTGEGTQDYGFRIYNPGLGKFLSVDPLTSKYPWYTPYQFAGNKPIWCIDLDGLEENFKPLEKYKYGEETDLQTTTANYVKAVPNTATNLVNGFGSLFGVITYNVSEFLRSPEDYFEEVGDYWSNSKQEVQHLKTRAQEIASDPINELTAPLKGPQGVENMLTIGLQVAMVNKTPVEFSSEANYSLGKNLALEEGELESGAYGTLKSMESGEKHHMPSNGSMNKFGVTKSEGTAINMRKELHSLTGSYKNSLGSKAFRNLEVKLLEAGKYDLAWAINEANARAIYAKKGYDMKILDAKLLEAKAHFFSKVVPKIKKKE